jgi:hypothetical protein
MKCVHIGCESMAYTRQVCRKHYNELMSINYAVGGLCKNGHLLDNGNEVFHMRNGKRYVTCRTCRSAAASASAKRTQIGDICKRGHKIMGENAEYYRHARNNAEHVRCRKCRLMNARERQARFRQTPEYKQYLEARRERESAYRSESQKRADRYDKILAVEVTQTNGSYTGLNYLKLGKRAQRAWEPLAEKFDQARGLCYRNPGPYIDYEEENTPSPNQAFQLCKGCPMLVECARFASAYKPVIGVWGGEVWDNGKVVGK